ncbi:MAG: hypothetical protein RL748_189 [Pseudomonadota bacterium]|jgi:hypothetical protein
MIFRVATPESFAHPQKRRKLALLVALLFHGAVFWLVMQPKPFLREKKPAEGNGEQTVWLAPLPKPAPKPAPGPAPAKTRQPSTAKALSRPPVLPPIANTITLPTPLPPPVPESVKVQPTPEPAEDMMALVESRRKRRAETQSAPDSEQNAESDSQRAVRQAHANLANLQARAKAANEQHGGVFSLGRISSFKAEFTFNGWNKNLKRQSPRLVEVELGGEKDIETAIIKSMIVQIRKEREAEFTWQSHRLGRVVPLNARPEFGAELQAFLMKEFFPDYRPQLH